MAVRTETAHGYIFNPFIKRNLPIYGRTLTRNIFTRKIEVKYIEPKKSSKPEKVI